MGLSSSYRGTTVFTFLEGLHKQSDIESHLQIIHRRQDTYPSVFILNKYKLDVLPLRFHFTQGLIRKTQTKMSPNLP